MKIPENTLKLIPSYVFAAADTLKQKGFEAFLVGGSVRDILLGKTPSDYDIATNAYPEVIAEIFSKSIPTGAKFGTMTVLMSDEHGETFDLQITTYRSEEDYFGGRWPAKVEFTKTIEEDLARRDFTINAIALDLSAEIGSPQLLRNPFDGLRDLELGIIRAVRDPLERFTEDGLRPVRACRLAAQLNFKIEPATLAAMTQTNHVTAKVSAERLRDELMKLLLKSSKPSIGLRLMQQTGILKLIIPELEDGMGVTQPEFHNDDVFEHSLQACDNAEDSVKLAALLHDIGKPPTMTKDEHGTHFYGHDLKGAEMTAVIMQRLKFPNSEIHRTANLVRWHMFYYPSADWRKSTVSDDDNSVSLTDEQVGKVLAEKGERQQGGWTDGAVRRLIHNVGGEEQIDELMKLRIADATANPKHKFNPKELDALAERIADVRAKDMAIKVTDLNITGSELIAQLQITAGPLVGETLRYLLDLVIEDVQLNNRETLLDLAAGFLRSKGVLN
jgi:poly(A) polymerase/tRNA nucleotidyltransferase (CCA-adding enzyme)